VTFFVDANAIVYTAIDVAARDNCVRVLRAIAAGDLDGRTSPAVLEEVWHVATRRSPGRMGRLPDAALKIFSPLLPVTEDALVHALSMPGSRLGPNDRLHVGTCVTNEIDAVLTADRAFDGVKGIRRIDPFDGEAVEELLAAA
jgi:predicted nucleic acid-binding protein